ncbi:hypothetical protein ACHHYP_08853 [Achlya hypogyna]|uniref:Ectopic P granules protein 5 n=1 Tax=Achlya hypogyna TaxID=1202772 RepID=A0A1V9YNS2_ACHHY|nr:hypothetical protein ACHHYP_08853 [Achlya hypogyna]
MATLVRKKKTKRAEQPLVATGAPYRGNGASADTAVAIKPIKVHLSAEELLLMDNFNDGSSPSAPDFDLLSGDPQMENWEAIMLGSPMPPSGGIAMPPLPTMEALDLNAPPSAPTAMAGNGESPHLNGIAYLPPPATAATTAAPEMVAPPLELPSVPAVGAKYSTVVPEHVTMATVHDLLVPATKISAPIYPALHLVKPIVFTPRVAPVRDRPLAPPPLEPLREVPRVPLRRIDNFEENLHLRDKQLQRYEEQTQALEKAPSTFYRLVEAYLYCEHALRAATTAVAALEADIADKTAAVWAIGYESVSASAMCGDLKTLTATAEFPTATIDLDKRDALVAQWQALRQLRSAETAACTYDRALAYLRVEQHLDNLLAADSLEVETVQAAMDVLWFLEKEAARPTSAVLGSVPSTLRRGQIVFGEQDAKQLQCPACGHLNVFATAPCVRCDALIIVPRSTVALSSPDWRLAVAQVRVSLRHWLGRCTVALEVAPPAAVVPHVLAHLMHLPLVASERRWALAFLQLPQLPWTASELDLFLALWHLLFHPTKLPPQVVVADDGSPRHERSSSLDEWLLLEESADPDDDARHLSDADYTAVCAQLPLDRAVAHVLAGPDPRESFAQLLYLVNECTGVFERFADYDLLVAHVSRGLGVVLQAAGAVPGSLFDQLFQIALFGVVQSRNAAVYHSLPSWSYASLSPAAAWDVLGGLFGLPAVAAKSYVAFQCLLAESPGLRARLHKQVARGPGAFLLGAMASLAAVSPWSELVQTVVHEVFLAFEATRATTVAVDVFGRICRAHPVAMSQLLALLPQHDAGLPLFPQLPLSLWRPTLADLHVVQAWLLQDNVLDPRSAVARAIVEQLNWGDGPAGGLFLDPFVHRFVALLLAEATVQLYEQKRHWPWSMDFRGWCWTQVQRLRFHTPDYVPLLPPIALDTDLSKEAMVLRRLTRGLPRSHLVLGHADPKAAALCITYVDGEAPEPALRQADDDDNDVGADADTDTKTPAQMEPVVLYLLCQLTTYLYSSAIDKYAPLLSLLVDHGQHAASLAVTECMVPRLPRLEQDDVAAFLKHYVVHNKELRAVVAALHRNWYFALEPRLPLVEQYLADGTSVPRETIVAIIQAALEQSCCVHPLLVPALCGQVPASFAETAKYYAVATLQTLKKTLRWAPEEVPEATTGHDGVCSAIRQQYMTLQSPAILQYWLVVVLSIPLWHQRPAYRAVVDAIVAAAMAPPANVAALAELETPFSLYYDALCAAATPPLSFVPPPASTFWPLFGGAGSGNLHFTFLALLLEIRKEKELYKALGHVVLKEKGKHKAKAIESLRAKGRLANELYVFGVDTTHPTVYGHADVEFSSWAQLKLFRVAHVLLGCPIDEPMLVLWWQLWFALYFASVGAAFFGHHLWELEAKSLTRGMLQTKLRQLSSHFSAQVVSHPSPFASELARLYSAMDAWLENTDVGLWMGHKESLPPHYCVGYATQLLQLSHVLLHTADTIDMRTETLCEQIAPLLWVHLCPPTPAPLQPPVAPAPPPSDAALAPVTWPEPMARPRLKYYRFSPVLPTTPGPLPLELSPGPFVDRALQYTENLSQLVALEADFVDKIGRLYVPRLRVETRTVPCAGIGGKEPQPCKRPSVLQLEYTEWHRDDATADVLTTCQAQAKRLNGPALALLLAPLTMVGDRTMYLQLSALDAQVLFQMLLVDAVVALLTADPDAWKAQGVAWFHALVGLDTKAVRRFPPFQELLWRSIQALGVAFIGVDQEETTGLLRFMLQDPARVVLLSDCFFPNNTPTRFVEYFATVMAHTQDLGGDARLQLLRRFDLARWLEADPIAFDRDTLLSLVLAELVLGAASPDIHRMHAKFLHVLCTRYLADHADKVVCALLGVYDQYYAADLQTARAYFEAPTAARGTAARPLDAAVWQAVQHLPPECWAALPLETLQQLVDRVAMHVTTARTTGHDRLLAKHDWQEDAADAYVLPAWQASHVLKPCLDLVVVWVRAQASAEMMWSVLVKLFEALLLVLYVPSAPEAAKAMLPWPPTDEATATTVCTALWASLHAFLELDTMPMQLKLDCIWSLVRSVLLPHAPDALVKAYGPVLARVPWEQWTLTEETLNAMKECLVAPVATAGYAVKFQSPLRLHVLQLLREVLARALWPQAYLETQPTHVQSSFFVKYHLLLFQVVVHHRDAALPLTFLSVLKHERRLGRPVKSAEVDAVANGCLALLLHPTLLCAPLDATTDGRLRFMAGLRLLLGLCGLDLVERAGDELKKAATLLRVLTALLHPTGPEWKAARDAVGHHDAYVAVVAALAAAATVVAYDALSLLHVHHDSYTAVFKADHLHVLYADIFRVANVPLVDRAFQQRTAVAHSWLALGEALRTMGDELQPSLSATAPLLEGHVEVLQPCAPVGAALASMLLSLAGLAPHGVWSIRAACSAVASVHVMAVLCERSLEAAVALDPRSSRADGSLKVPELSTEDFVATCIAHHAFLTLVAFSWQQAQAVAQAPWTERPPMELQLCARLVDYVERAAAVDDALPATAEPKLLLLFATVVRQVLALETVAPTFKRDMLARVSNSLWALGESRAAGAGLNTLQRAIGFSFLQAFAKLRFSTALHTAALALSLFVRVHSRKNAPLRVDATTPLQVSPKSQKLIKALEAIGAERKDLVGLVVSFCSDARHSLADHAAFFRLLFSETYPTAPYLLEA